LTTVKRIEYIREKEVIRFLDAAINILSYIKGFDFAIKEAEFINSKIRFHIVRDPDAENRINQKRRKRKRLQK
jgi:hypothetical protein